MRRALLVAVALVPAACAGILGLRRDRPRPFEHRPHSLAGVACVTCHRGIDRAGDDGPLHLPDTADCIACHTQPHDRRDCGGCHGSPWTAHDAAQAREHLRFSHARHLPRLAGNCVRCHRGIAEAGAPLRPPMAACTSCHEHAGELSGRACDRCHVDLAEEATLPSSHLVHGPDFVREHGARAGGAADLCASCHAERFCASCHGAAVPELPARRAFDRTDGAAFHRAGFRARHAEEAAASGGVCATCHAEQFCRDCHADAGLAATSEGGGFNPHPAGWVGAVDNDHGRAARRDPLSCAACHSGGGEALCVGCHRVGGIGGNPHPPGWSTRRSINTMPCLLCHPATGSLSTPPTVRNRR